MNPRPSIFHIRLAAGGVLVLGAAMACVGIYTGLQSHDADSAGLRSFVSVAGPVVICLGLGLGVWALLSGVAVLVEMRESGSEAPSPGPKDNREVVNALTDLQAAVERLANRPDPELAAYVQQAPVRHEPARPAIDPETVPRIIALLEELRELSLLTEPQRQARARQMAMAQRPAHIQQAAEHLANYEWGKADRLIQQLETSFPGDAEVARLREALAERQKTTDDEALGKVRAQVEDLMALSNWDQALALAKGFADNFPASQDGQSLVARVTRERDLYCDNTVSTMYDDVKDGIERRQWRKALAAAQRLIEKFPDHKRTAKVRRQIKTLQTNAEIEERQETESRIHELIRSKRYTDALEIAEDLMVRFPSSPQAETLEELMPKLRTLAIEEEAASF